MKQRTRWLLSGLALGAGCIGALVTHRKKKDMYATRKVGDVWARPGMPVTFRAELMPGRERNERTYHVKELLSSGRVSLHGTGGEHAEKEFEPIQVDRPTA